MLQKQHYDPYRRLCRAIQSRPFAGALRHLSPRDDRTPDKRSIGIDTAFAKVYYHFVTNRHPPAIQSNGLCNYRGMGPGGTLMRCAIGLLIPNILYSPFMEGVPVMELLKQYPKLRYYFGRLPRRFLAAIQAAHDESARAFLAEGISFRDRIADELYAIARQYNLYVPQS